MDYKIDSLISFIQQIEKMTKDYSLYEGMIDKFLDKDFSSQDDLIFKKNFVMREWINLLDWFNRSESRTNFDWMGRFDDIEEKINKSISSFFNDAEILENTTLMKKIERYTLKNKEITAETEKLTDIIKKGELICFLNDEKKDQLKKKIQTIENNIVFNDSDRRIFQSINKRLYNDSTPSDSDYYSDFFSQNDCDDLCKKLDQMENTTELRNAVLQVKLDIRTPAQPFQYFYRGEPVIEWKLRPSVLRSDYSWDKESFYYHEILARCPNEFKNSSFLNNLVTMQHYGCPTRLLDITTSPLVALYFACESNPDSDGKVLIFPIIQGSVSYTDSDKALILSCLAHFSKNDQKCILSEIKKMTKVSKTDGPLFPYFSKLLQEIKLEKPSFKSEIKIGDLLNPLFVQPNMTNSRIQNQHGAFLLSGLFDNLDTCTERLNCRVAKQRIIIKASAKREILAQLDTIGINKGTVYPNIEKVAEYLINL